MLAETTYSRSQQNLGWGTFGLPEISQTQEPDFQCPNGGDPDAPAVWGKHHKNPLVQNTRKAFNSTSQSTVEMWDYAQDFFWQSKRKNAPAAGVAAFVFLSLFLHQSICQPSQPREHLLTTPSKEKVGGGARPSSCETSFHTIVEQELTAGCSPKDTHIISNINVSTRRSYSYDTGIAAWYTGANIFQQDEANSDAQPRFQGMRSQELMVANPQTPATRICQLHSRKHKDSHADYETSCSGVFFSRAKMRVSIFRKTTKFKKFSDFEGQTCPMKLSVPCFSVTLLHPHAVNLFTIIPFFHLQSAMNWCSRTTTQLEQWSFPWSLWQIFNCQKQKFRKILAQTINSKRLRMRFHVNLRKKSRKWRKHNSCGGKLPLAIFKRERGSTELVKVTPQLNSVLKNFIRKKKTAINQMIFLHPTEIRTNSIDCVLAVNSKATWAVLMGRELQQRWHSDTCLITKHQQRYHKIVDETFVQQNYWGKKFEEDNPTSYSHFSYNQYCCSPQQCTPLLDAATIVLNYQLGPHKVIPFGINDAQYLHHCATNQRIDDFLRLHVCPKLIADCTLNSLRLVLQATKHNQAVGNHTAWTTASDAEDNMADIDVGAAEASTTVTKETVYSGATGTSRRTNVHPTVDWPICEGNPLSTARLDVEHVIDDEDCICKQSYTCQVLHSPMTSVAVISEAKSYDFVRQLHTQKGPYAYPDPWPGFHYAVQGQLDGRWKLWSAKQPYNPLVGRLSHYLNPVLNLSTHKVVNCSVEIGEAMACKATSSTPWSISSTDLVGPETAAQVQEGICRRHRSYCGAGHTMFMAADHPQQDDMSGRLPLLDVNIGSSSHCTDSTSLQSTCLMSEHDVIIAPGGGAGVYSHYIVICRCQLDVTERLSLTGLGDGGGCCATFTSMQSTCLTSEHDVIVAPGGGARAQAHCIAISRCQLGDTERLSLTSLGNGGGHCAAYTSMQSTCLTSEHDVIVAPGSSAGVHAHCIGISRCQLGVTERLSLMGLGDGCGCCATSTSRQSTCLTSKHDVIVALDGSTAIVGLLAAFPVHLQSHGQSQSPALESAMARCHPSGGSMGGPATSGTNTTKEQAPMDITEQVTRHPPDRND